MNRMTQREQPILLDNSVRLITTGLTVLLTLDRMFTLSLAVPTENSVLLVQQGLTCFESCGRIGYDEPSQIPD